jgi:hypothetical protein
MPKRQGIEHPLGGPAMGPPMVNNPDPRSAPAVEEDACNELIEVAGIPLVVWAARLSLFLFIQAAIVLGSYASYGFGTHPGQFGPGFRLDPLHASINLVWGLIGSIIGFFLPRFAIAFVLAFAVFYTVLAGLGTFTPHHFGMQLDATDNAINWLLACGAWGLASYALWQACLLSDEAL